MKLVFVTRKVDRGDPLTGFVFGWIAGLAKNLDYLYVICQEKGDTSGLPDNVEVHSFGKEKGYGKMKQGYRLLVLGFRLGNRADGFFVHMHPIYAIIAFLPAKIFGKKLVLWYTHKSVDLKLRVAHFLVDEILTASKDSFRLPSRKVKIVGHGIDLEKFYPLPHSLPTSGREVKAGFFPLGGGGEVGGTKFRILSIGRISPVKDYETLIKAVEILVNKKNIKDLDVQIFGNVGLAKHQSYLESLVKFVENAELDDYIDFQAGVAYDYVPQILAEADLLVNLSETGSLDKNVLEAAACGRLVLTSNDAFVGPLQKISADLIFKRDQPVDLAEKIVKLKNLELEERQDLENRLRAWVEKEHNLDNLARRIVESFK